MPLSLTKTSASLPLCRAAKRLILTPTLYRCTSPWFPLFLVLLVAHQVKLAAAAARLLEHNPDIIRNRIRIPGISEIPVLLSWLVRAVLGGWHGGHTCNHGQQTV